MLLETIHKSNDDKQVGFTLMQYGLAGTTHIPSAHQKPLQDFETLFGERGACGGCWCMWPRLARSDFQKQKGAGNKKAMKKDRGVRPGAGICAAVADRADHAEGVVTRYPPRRSARRMLRMMETGRREFLECLTAALVTVIPVAAGPRGANSMYGLIVKITAAPGKRDEFIAILKESAADMPGCLSYIVAPVTQQMKTLSGLPRYGTAWPTMTPPSQFRRSKVQWSEPNRWSGLSPRLPLQLPSGEWDSEPHTPDEL